MAHVEPVGYRRFAVGMTGRRGGWLHAPWALVVSASLLGVPLQAKAWGPAPDGLLREADAHRKDGEHREAADKYAAYYRAQTESKRASGTGAYIIDFAVGSYLAAFEASGDVAALQACRDLLREFLGEVERVHGNAEQPFTVDARGRLEQVEAKLAEREPEPKSGSESEPESESESESESEPESESESESEPVPSPAPKSVADVPPPRSGPDKLGIGLVVGGSIVVLGGVGMLIGATQYVPLARERLRESEAENEGSGMTPDRDAYLEKAVNRRNLMLGLGAAVVAIGLVPTIWGAVRLARHGKRGAKSTARLTIGPVGGLSLHASF